MSLGDAQAPWRPLRRLGYGGLGLGGCACIVTSDHSAAEVQARGVGTGRNRPERTLAVSPAVASSLFKIPTRQLGRVGQRLPHACCCSCHCSANGERV